MITYSFVIPHKNISLLLKRCLDSIPSRSDVEIIVIDDNSNEESIQQLKKLSRKELRIIYTTENKGAGFARNIGVNEANGKWILFADADDFFLPNLLEKLDQHKEQNQKLVLFKSCCRNSNNLREIGQRQNICNHIASKMIGFRKGEINHVDLLLGTGVPWAKMVRRDFLKTNDICFEEVRYSNDTGWITQLAVKIDKCDISISDEEIYCWTDRVDSLYYTRNKEAFFCRFNVRYRQYLLLKKNNFSTYFDFCAFVDTARDFGLLFLLDFYKILLKERYHIPAIYKFEKKLHFNFPYCYLFVQLVKTFFCSFFFFIPQKRNRIRF